MRIKGYFIVGVLCFFYQSAVMAALPPDVWYFATTLKRVMPDDNRKLNSASTAQYLLGRTFGQFNTLDIGFDDQDYSLSSGGGSASQSSIDLTYRHLFKLDSMEWFMSIGAGEIEHTEGGQLYKNSTASLGGGLQYSMWDKGPALNADLHLRRHFDKDSNVDYKSYDDWVLGFSVIIPFYTPSTSSPQPRQRQDRMDEAVAVAKVEIETITPEKGKIKPLRYGEKFVDSDSDGINDDVDKCLHTPIGAPITLTGCALDTDGDSVADLFDKCRGTPRGVKVNERGCGFDDDGDGVANYRDSCLKTIPDVSIGGDGCELDSDNDGVVDSLDRCVGTPPKVEVEPMGCHLTELVILQGVNFKTGSDELGSAAKKALSKISKTLNRHPNMRVEIAGHTDSSGNTDINKNLSMRRATSARKFLVKLGINASVLATKGYASDEPVAGNDTEQGRLQNRRVELRIVEVD